MTSTLTPVYIDELLTKRDVCVECDTSEPLVCPSCNSTQQCQFIYPTNCTECSRAVCVDTQTTTTSTASSSNSSPSTGAIAGGVIGGVAAIAIITYLVWRFCIKTRRQPISKENWEDDQLQQTNAAEKVVVSQAGDARASVHTRHSIASTVLTRASNIIQIAYIPGVTNRATPSSPGVLVPPVPPIPIAISQASTPASTEDQHFFVPGDLRDSTYSGLSGYTDRTSYGRASYAPRSSVASTIYGKNAVIVAPAQTGMRAKPAMVSVKSANSGGGSGSAGSATPPVPSVDYEKYGPARPASRAESTFSVGSTFLNNASAQAATPARAMVVRVGSVSKKGSKSTINKTKSTEELASPRVGSLNTGRDSGAVTLIDDSPVQDQGPFSDPPESPQRSNTSLSNSLSAVIEEAALKASQRASSSAASQGRGKSPFGDENATHED